MSPIYPHFHHQTPSLSSLASQTMSSSRAHWKTSSADPSLHLKVVTRVDRAREDWSESRPGGLHANEEIAGLTGSALPLIGG